MIEKTRFQSKMYVMNTLTHRQTTFLATEVAFLQFAFRFKIDCSTFRFVTPVEPSMKMDRQRVYVKPKHTKVASRGEIFYSKKIAVMYSIKVFWSESLSTSDGVRHIVR